MPQLGLVERAQELLGRPVEGIQPLVPEDRRHQVLRCQFAGLSAVVKDAGQVEIDAYLRLQDSNVTPRVLAHEPGTIVIEDLVGPRLDEVLEYGDNDAAVEALHEMAEAFAKVHRLTLDHVPTGDLGLDSHAEGGERGAITAFRQVCDRLAVPAVFDTFNPGPVTAMNQVDVGPDNCIVTADGARLIDFELARVDDPFLDTAHWTLGFPCCGYAGAIPPELVAEMDAIHQDALGMEAVPGTRERAAALLLCDRVARYVEWGVLEEAWVWGRVAGRRRIVSLTSHFDDDGHLPAFTETVRMLEQELRRRWPDIGDTLPTYQALS
jgi:hypothetical protein